VTTLPHAQDAGTTAKRFTFDSGSRAIAYVVAILGTVTIASFARTHFAPERSERRPPSIGTSQRSRRQAGRGRGEPERGGANLSGPPHHDDRAVRGGRPYRCSRGFLPNK
jgi:hypothetical protein